ncbi:MAG: hypothetical protein ACOX6T_12610 [Myxococcales bacterium]|jgi:hypothetical protein
MTRVYRLLPLLALCAAGCATLPPPYEASSGRLVLAPLVIYQDSAGPLSYQAPVGQRLRGAPVARVEGRACQSGLQIPLGLLVGVAENGGDVAAAVSTISAGWGDGGYERALQEALEDARLKGYSGELYDVRADLNVIQVLGVWRQQCLVVTASVPAPERP